MYLTSYYILVVFIVPL